MALIDISTPSYPNTFVHVDDADLEWLSRWKWCAGSFAGKVYATRTEKCANGGKASVLMHRQILGMVAHDGRVCDHKDGDRLNNRRGNLRECTHSQNHANKKKTARPRDQSQFKGVSFHRHSGLWHGRIQINKKQISLGYFKNEVETARAYDAAARQHFGEFARLNFP